MLKLLSTQTFIPISEDGRALAFYRDVIGLELVEDTLFASVFTGPGCEVRLAKTPGFTPQPFTVLGWVVEDLHAEMARLKAAGVEFLSFGGMGQDDNGVWSPAPGVQIVWFKDPDGNTLSLSTQP